MFNRKSIYALNKKDPDAIVYMDANEVIVRLTREDFASEEEFLKWKSWSDGNYHTEDNQDVVEGKHNTSMLHQIIHLLNRQAPPICGSFFFEKVCFVIGKPKSSYESFYIRGVGRSVVLSFFDVTDILS